MAIRGARGGSCVTRSAAWSRRCVDGARMLVRTPRAIGPITSITLDQVGQGVILTLALVVFRDVFGAGVGSFSNVVGAGGVGVLAGIATVGALEDRFSKEQIVASAFVIGGMALVLTGAYLRGWTILVASFVVGLTFAWKKIPVDTMVQESLPDGYRGRVFSVYDVFYTSARIVAAAVAIALVPAARHAGIGRSSSGCCSCVWAPVLPRWVGGVARDPPACSPKAGGPRSGPRVALGRGGGAGRGRAQLARGARRRAPPCFRLSLQDGTILDVGRVEPDGNWTIDREREDQPAG